MNKLFIVFLFIFTCIVASGHGSAKNLSSSDEYFASAGELFNRDKRACANQFQSFIKRHPKDKLIPEAEFMIGECFFSLDPTSSEALGKFQGVLRKYTSSKQAEGAALRIAEIYYNRKDYSGALKSLEIAESRYSKGYLQFEIKFLKAKCYIVLERFLEAEKILAGLVSDQPAYKENKRFNYTFGLVNYQLEKDTIALENLEKVDSPEALLFSSKALVRSGKPLLAIGKLKELINSYPESSLRERAHYLVGEAFFAAQDYTSAINSYERFLHLYSRGDLRGPAMYKIGCSYLEDGNYLQARTNFQSFLQTDPRSEFTPLAVYLTGESFIREKRFKEACFAYGDMVSSYPDNFYAPNAQYKLAWCYSNLKDLQQTKSSLIKFKQLFAHHRLLPLVELLLGNTLCELESYQAAAAAYQRVIDRTGEIETREAALALMSRVNYLSENYTSLVSGYHYILKHFPPVKSMWRPITYLYLAEGYLKQGLYNEALELYKSIQSIYPTSHFLMYVREGSAWAHFLNEDYSEAQDIREKIRSIAREEELPEELVLVNQYELGNALFNQKKYLKSLEIFDVFIKKNPRHYMASRACFRLGLCYHQLEYFGQAIETWEELERNYPDTPEASESLWQVADTYFRAQAYDKAIQTYKKILERYVKDAKDSARAYIRISQSYYNAKNFPLAVQSLKDLIEKFPSEPQAYEALDFLTALLEIPDSKETALSALNDITKSLGKNAPLSVEVHFRLARNYFENKNYSKSAEILKGLISELLESQRFADAGYYLAESYYQLSKFDKAASTYVRFVNNFPEDKRVPLSLYRIGSAQFKTEKFAEAAINFEKLFKAYPDTEYSASAIYNAALAYRKSENWDKATGALQTYQEKYPQLAQSQGVDVDIVTMYEEQNQYLKAIEVLKAGRNKESKQTEAWRELTFRIAEDYMALGEKEEGISEYRKIISGANPLLDSWTINAVVKLGEHYEKNNKPGKALSLYEMLYRKASGMANKPSWFGAIEGRIEAVRVELNHRKNQK